LALGLLAEGQTVGALVLLRITLVGADLDAVQTAVILTAAVVGAGGDGAVNAAVGLFHNDSLLYIN
jgi:hypothetical protein